MILDYIVGYFIIGLIIGILGRLVERVKYSLADYLVFTIVWPYLIWMILIALLNKIKL